MKTEEDEVCTQPPALIKKGHGDMIVALTKRASRAARSPPPSELAAENAWRVAASAADHLESEGFKRTLKLPPVRYRLAATAGRAGYRDVRKNSDNLDASTPAHPTAALSHVFSLQRPIDAGVREAPFLTFQTVLPLKATHLAAAGMRSNSVRASVVHKAKKTQGGGQQTTRNNLGDLSAAWSAQAGAVSLTLAAAHFLAAKEGITPKNPAATSALDTASLVAHARIVPPSVFIVTSSTRLLPHALPTRICTHNFLDSMRQFAHAELDMGTIRSVVPQQINALRSICNSIVDKTDGVSIWAAWVLLVHMVSDPRLRRMVKASRISDMEAATASLFQNYARAEVTRRARMDATSAGKKSKTVASGDGDDDDESGEEDDDAGGCDVEDAIHALNKTTISKATRAVHAHKKAPAPKAVDVATKAEDGAGTSAAGTSDAGTSAQTVETQMALRNAADKQTLALKRKRPPCSGVVQVSGGYLDYWSAALASDYASILRLMITQSKELANSAAVETLSGQAPHGFHAVRNALLVDISSRNAVKSAEALSGLVVTTPEQVPQILTWRCRDHNSRMQTHAGLVRSISDASNSTLHACSVAPPHCQPLGNHHVCVWSNAIRNTTPYDASTSLLPGVSEGALHLHCLETKRMVFHSRHHLTRVFEIVKNRAARAASDGSLDVTLTGVARGILVIRARIVVGDSQIEAGKQVARAMVEAAEHAKVLDRETPTSDFESCSLLSHDPLVGIPEPYATPSNNLALCMQVNEQVRVLMKNKSHRGDPCRHLCGLVTAAEMGEACVEEYDKPQTLLPVVDCSVAFLEDPTMPGECLPGRRDATLRNVAITLTVCGDSPVRLPELLDTYCADACASRATDATDAGILGATSTARVFELLALTLGGAARASELNDVSSSISAGHVNSSIASAKRILVGDLNLRLFLTLYQVYRVGTSNVPRSCETTPWSGTYGAGFDIGTSGGIGIRASSVTADKRHVISHSNQPRIPKKLSGACFPGAGTTARF